MEKEAEETRKEGWRGGGREGGREEEGIITSQVHSQSRQDLHSNTHLQHQQKTAIRTT